MTSMQVTGESLAASAGLSAASAVGRARDLAGVVESQLAAAAAAVEAMPAGGHQVSAKAIHAMEKRCQRIVRQL